MAQNSRGLSDEELVSLIERKTDNADSLTTDLQKDRENALKFYRQDPIGNEQDGRSQVITTEVRDTIEWILPQLVEMFIGNENPVLFPPRNAEDIEGADQETKYVRYVYNDQNSGFLNTYTWFKDALLQKNGIIKAFWDDDISSTKEEYENQSLLEVQALGQDNELSIESITTEIEGEDTEIGEDFDLAALNQEATFKVVARRDKNDSQVRVVTIPPENFLVDPNHPSLDLKDVSFCREDQFMTESELLEEGISQEIIDGLPSSDERLRKRNTETQTRFKDEGGVTGTLDFGNKATRRIKVSDVYIKADMKGDGIAELRFVKLGADSEILENEEVDSVPYFAITPNILTHKFYGMSIADMVADLQLVKSTLWRQMLDNLYLTNNPRNAVIKGQVELDDLLVSRPGGIVRMNRPDAVTQLTVPFVADKSFPMMDMIDRMREERTGVSSTTQGLDPDALSKSTNLVGSMIMNASMGRIKMIASIFAETGFKSMMLHIHELVLKHEENEKIADLNGGEFVTVNPSTWKTRRDMQVRIGTGFADKNQKVAALQQVSLSQEKIFAAQGGEGPLLNAQNVYNLQQDQLELSGLDNRDRYFSNPEKFEPPPAPEDPTSEALEIAEADVTLRAQEGAAKHELAVKAQQDDVDLRVAKLQQELVIAREKIASDAQIEREKIQAGLVEAQIKEGAELRKDTIKVSENVQERQANTAG